jgi:hypothetical protein
LTLAGSGTGASPLGIALPVTLTRAVPNDPVVLINNPGSGTSAGTGLSAIALGKTAIGVYGYGDSTGVEGDTTTGIGVIGYALKGLTIVDFPGGVGVYGVGDNVGVYGSGRSAGAGVAGNNFAPSPAVIGENTGTGPGVEGLSKTTGVVGVSLGTTVSATGVSGECEGANATGVIGKANNGGQAYGVWGQSSSGYAGHFDGRVAITGALSVTGAITAGVKDFRIDHPLDPENKYLVHASVESSEMTNIYSGNVTLGPGGFAVVNLPAWVEAANGDFRYQLTCIGGFAGVYVARELEGGRFTIGGGIPGMKVSWQLTGIRRDAYARAHPLVVEEEKAETERGLYLHPESFDLPEEKGIDVSHRRAKEAFPDAVASVATK